MKKSIFGRSPLALAYLAFMVVFVIFPLLVIMYYSFTDGQGHLTLSNYTYFLTNARTLGTVFYSLVIGILTTVICLLVAYPVAYILAKGEYSRKHSFLMVFVLPMWINFTLRITALKEILTMIEGNLAYHTFFNTIFCMVYDFLPFMIMPLYNSLTKIDKQYVEAASDLGAKNWQILIKVIIPLSVPGIISGVTMVFLPAMTNYVVLDMVYNSTYIMGSLIGSYFSAFDWHNGSMVSVTLLTMICLVTIVTNHLNFEKEGAR